MSSSPLLPLPPPSPLCSCFAFPSSMFLMVTTAYVPRFVHSFLFSLFFFFFLFTTIRIFIYFKRIPATIQRDVNSKTSSAMITTHVLLICAVLLQDACSVQLLADNNKSTFVCPVPPPLYLFFPFIFMPTAGCMCTAISC